MISFHNARNTPVCRRLKGIKKGETKTPKRGRAYPVSLNVCHTGWARMEQIIISKTLKAVFQEYDQNIQSTLSKTTNTWCWSLSFFSHFTVPIYSLSDGHLSKTDTWCWSLPLFSPFTVTILSIRRTPL